MKHSMIAGAIVLTFAGSPAFAQQACVALLQHGLYDHYRQQHAASSASSTQNSLCTSYNQYRSDKVSGSVKVSYGLASGGGSLSSDQIDAIGQVMCSTGASAQEASSNLALYSDKIDPGAVQAFSACMSQYADGLQISTEFREEDQGEVSITARYVAPPASNDVTVRGVKIDPEDAFVCSGTLSKAGTSLSVNSVAMSCARKIGAAPIEYLGRRVFAPPATITIETNAGSIIRNFTSIPAGPPPVPLVLPVGAIIAFSGTLADAAAMESNGWFICDGRSISNPNAGKLFNTRTPDLKEHFLMGSAASGQQGGVNSVTLPTQHVTVAATNFDGPFPSTPHLGPLPGEGWGTFHHIVSEGDIAGQTFDNRPAFYSVLYLIKAM